MTPDGHLILRSPREASSTFSLGGTMTPRPKNLFYVSFIKSGVVSSWQRTLGFLAKSVERPGAQVQTEELNQYNKRRIITTGIKHNPIRLQLYDTIDSQAVQMWDEYAKQYFGDYRHDGYYSDYQSDIIGDQWNDNANGGFGFAPLAATPNVTDDNAQFFLQVVSIYQVYGGNYVQFDLFNPKIINFEMDQLSYDVNDISMVSMQLAYEAVIHVNSGVPQPISGNSYLSEIFKTSYLNGDVLDNPNVKAAPIFSSLQTPTDNTSTTFQPYIASTSTGTLSNSAGSVGTGALSAFGNFNFGSLTPTQQTSVGTEISALAAQNPQLAAALNLTSTNTSPPASNRLINPYNTQTSLDAQVYYAAQSMAQGAAGSGLNSSGINLASALMAAALSAAGIDATVGGDSVVAATTSAAGAPQTADIKGADGTANPSPPVLAVLNATSSPTVQMGVNNSAPKPLNG